MKIKKEYSLIVIVLTFSFIGWGYEGHDIINRNTVLSFSAEMSPFVDWANALAEHGSDADRRKGSDPSEGHKHYIDIDNYPEFLETGAISQDYDSLVAIHGSSFVSDQGILPWTILATMDSLQAAFSQRQFESALLLAADLGHYVGDAHMPLHLTRNYDGQFTGQSGVHSRYESGMIGIYKNQISFEGDSVRFITDVSDFVFQFIYRNYEYLDSILQADSEAFAIAGSLSSDRYFYELWGQTGGFTIQLFANASNKLAALIYTAWVKAGRPLPGNSNVPVLTKPRISFSLSQNYPNPFNPVTKIRFHLQKSEHVTLKIFNLAGQHLETIANGFFSAGEHEVTWQANGLPSGVYFCKLQVNEALTTGHHSDPGQEGQRFSETRKLILQK